MKTIRVSEDVWAAIAAQGKFGETEDDVLHRILKISENNVRQNSSTIKKSEKPQYGWKERRTLDRMTQRVEDNKLILEFDCGAKFEKALPVKNNRVAIRKIRDEAVEFVQSNRGTKGQEHAAIRALTSRGYHVSKVNFSELV